MNVKDRQILRRVDEACATTNTTRADVLCALVRAFIEVRPTIEPERKAPEVETCAARAEAAIMRVMHSRHHRCTVRELKAATSSRRISVRDWDNALKTLCKAGELDLGEERTASGRTRRVVTLASDGEALTENGATL